MRFHYSDKKGRPALPRRSGLTVWDVHVQNTQNRKNKSSYPLPVWSGVFKHRERIGPALWEFLWCIDRTTRESDGIGYVLGGKIITSREIAEDFFGPERAARHVKTIERHLQHLHDNKIIERRQSRYGCRIYVLRSKKFTAWPHKSRKDKSVLPGDSKRNRTVPSQSSRKDKSVLGGDKFVPPGSSVPINDNTVDYTNNKEGKPPVQERVRDFLVWWGKEAYPKVYEREPTIAWARDMKLLKPLFEKNDDGAMRAAALAYLSERNDFVEGHPLSKFIGTQFDRWREKSSKTVSGVGNGSRSKFSRLAVD